MRYPMELSINKLGLVIITIVALLLISMRAVYADSIVQFFEQHHLIGVEVQATSDLAVGDIDNDGDLDVVVSNTYFYNNNNLIHWQAQNYLYRNDRLGNFSSETKEPIGPINSPSAAVALGDLDHDGDLDLVVANAIFTQTTESGEITLREKEAHNRIYANDGHGAFTSVYTFTATDNTTSLVLADMNGNGSLDIVFGNDEESNYIYWNDGTGVFSNESRSSFGNLTEATTSIAVGDLDLDNRLDLLVGNFNQPTQIYLNSGSNDWLDATTQALPTAATRSVAIADLDGQLGPELILGNLYEQNSIYYNDGTGTYTTTLKGVFGDIKYPTQDLVLADFDGDLQLDIAVGYDRILSSLCSADRVCTQGSLVYLNNGVGHFSTVVGVPQSSLVATKVAAGDMNNDGLIDLVEGKNINHNALNFNSGLKIFPTTRTFAQEADIINSIAVGDLDGKDGPDIIGALDGINQFYLNDGSGNFTLPTEVDQASERSRSVVLGDIDADFDLDVVIANRLIVDNQHIGELQVYKGDNQGNFTQIAKPVLLEGSTPEILALGDLDADGDLDLVVGGGGPNGIYLNDGNGNFINGKPFSVGPEWTWGLALGDLDADGDLDIVVGNQIGDDAQNRIYFNDGHAGFEQNMDLGNSASDTRAIAIGDMDNDDDLDIVEGNEGQQNWIYLNDGLGNFPDKRPYGPGNDDTIDIEVADYDENGLLDIFDTNQSSVYLNDGFGNFINRIAIPLAKASDAEVADLNRDGHLDFVLGTVPEQFISNVQLHASTATGLIITQPGTTAPSQGYSTAEILTGPTVPINYQLYDKHSTPMRAIRACYSIKGGGAWRIAVPSEREQPKSEMIVHPKNGCPYVPAWETPSGPALATSPTGVNHTFTWDVYESGFFGRSDNVILRIEALPDVRPNSHRVAGPYERALVATATSAFRLRGTQIQVVDEGGVGIPDALVYQRKEGQVGPGVAIGNGNTPYRTDEQGYLQGFGEIALGDELLALAPQPWQPTDTLTWAHGLTDTIHLYHTNGVPKSDGLTTQIGQSTPSTTVTQLGPQILAVSAANPLLLLNVLISLEWDASTEEGQSYLGQLRASLDRASAHLYDFTNGQVALGEVTVLQNAEDWGYADVVVQAANRLRPYAVQGGVVTTTTVDLDQPEIQYETGHVRMGATWSRYGEPGEELGADWALALAHELSHYFFFLDDTYLGLDENDLLISVNSCAGSVMGDMYNPSGENTEFVPDANWLDACRYTLAHHTLKRSEWATIAGRYTMLNVPTTYTENTGPSWMPFALTTVTVLDPVTPTTALHDPTFYFDYADGDFSSSNARAFLIRDGKYAFDLGSPLGGQNILKARGAQLGDLLCAFDSPRSHFGCTPVTGTSERLQLRSDPDWQPEIQIRPITSSTLQVHVRTLLTEELSAELNVRVFPEFGEATPSAVLNSANNYTTEFHFTARLSTTEVISVPVTLGHVLVWSGAEENPSRASMVAFRMGGNLGKGPAIRAGGPAIRAGGPAIRAGGPAIRAGGPAVRAGGAPVVSADGQMIFFTETPEAFQEGELYIVQSTGTFPSLPAAKKLVGLGYSLLTSPNVQSVIPGSISLQYLGTDALQQGVTEGEEAQLTIYYHPVPTSDQIMPTWQPLATVRNSRYNLASAPSQGPGIYVLLAGPQEPEITEVTTTWSYTDEATTILMKGHGFLKPLSVQLLTADGTVAATYTPVIDEAGALRFTTDAGLSPQEYWLRVINGDETVAVAPHTFAVVARAPALCFHDNFESGPGQWNLEGEWSDIRLSQGASRAITDSPDGNYDSALPNQGTTSTGITSRSFDLANCPKAELTFRHAYVIATGKDHDDWGIVEIWEETTATWHEVAKFQGGGVYKARSAAAGEEWQDAQWERAKVKLKKYQGTVKMRFRLQVDENVADRGWLIDDIRVQPKDGRSSVSDQEPLRLFLPVIFR